MGRLNQRKKLIKRNPVEKESVVEPLGIDPMATEMVEALKVDNDPETTEMMEASKVDNDTEATEMMEASKVDVEPETVAIEEVSEAPVVAVINTASVLNIVGAESINKRRKKRITPINPNSKVSKVILAIGETVEKGQEFITSPINYALKDQGFRDCDISGQLYALKKSGVLVNRYPETEEEVERLGANLRIWTTTDAFWDRYEQINAAINNSSDFKGED